MGAESAVLRPFLADLHVHTVLSPCAEVEMIPPLIVRRARELGLGIIAVTDHNSAENVAAVVEAARGLDLAVLPGMEVQTREEVHLLCLFDSVEQALDWQEFVYAHLPALKNREEFFGAQFVVDATGDYVRSNDRLLITSTSLSVEQAALQVEQRKGLCIPAHVDRPSYSMLANLGFIPQDVRWPAVEVSRNADIQRLRLQHPSLGDYAIVASGDAHRLSEMTDRTVLTVAQPTVAEISLALHHQGGRRTKVLGQ
jgi:PHP family Zn ribbon phosphoesterase